jgi:hypothetical protein
MPRKGIYINRKGRPLNMGYEVSGFKEVKADTIEENLKMEDKYTNIKSGEPLVYERHPNRNLDKPQIDKPRFN